MDEIWKGIPEYEGWYQVSNLGRVKRVADKPEHHNGKIRKTHITSTEYVGINLNVNGVRTNRKVHQLVASAFIGKRPKGLDLNHINGIKTDNRPENLEYLTRSDNNKHAFSIGLMSNVGENSSRALFTEKEVQGIRATYANGGYTHRSLAKKLGVSKSTITAIILRYNWAHIP